MAASSPVIQRQTGDRILPIDSLRALTMVLMIFVNDLWTLSGIPAWLAHVKAGVDGMGLADAVFPAFLFIVGLSLPFALAARIKKGDTRIQLVQHILLRAFALVVMGVFLVNGEYIQSGSTGLSVGTWNALCCTSFIMIWNRYPKSFPSSLSFFIRILGAVVLLLLAYYYQGGTADQLSRFKPRWWGILGLIGWSYLAGALITLWAGNQIMITAISWAFFTLLSLLHHAQLLPTWLGVIPGAISSGSLTALVLAGALAGQVLCRYRSREQFTSLTVMYICISALWLGLAFMTRPYWGISKLGATPAWHLLCSGLTLLVFLGMYTLIELRGKLQWLAVIRPAGTHTLLTYLIPYYIYAAVAAVPVYLPDFLLHGIWGLGKSLAFALACVGITKLLSHRGIQLKI